MSYFTAPLKFQYIPYMKMIVSKIKDESLYNVMKRIVCELILRKLKSGVSY